MRYNEETVELSSIDRCDSTYRITSETSIDVLAESINHIGIINPPVLRPKNSDFTIIAGFRRIEACQSLGWSKIPARILASGTSEVECAKIAVTDNALQRPLNLLEESRAYALISGIFEDDREMAKVASSLGLPGNPSLIKKIETISRLPQPVQNGIISNTISLPTALELVELPHEVGVGFSELFNRLKLSLNKQRQLLTLVKEIAIREDASIEDVLGETYLRETLLSEELDRNQKARKIRNYLKKRRFPEITRTEKAFEARVKALQLGSGVKLIPPIHFEGATYTLSIYFDNLNELHDRRETLDQLIQNPNLHKILEQT